MAKEITVGIDLGTTYSCCYYYDVASNDVKLVRYVNGKASIPSCADFNTIPVVVGIPNPNAITEVKRIIGLRFDDEKVQKEIEDTYFPFTIIEDEDGYCKIQFQPNNSERSYDLKPEEISAIVLRQIKNEILKALGGDDKTIVNAVITVPAYFTEEQKKRTQYAAKISGLNLITMLQEPSAAAYAYKGKVMANGHYLAYDLGGGTFDLTLMKVENNGRTIKFLASTGDTHLGGLDFDKNFTERIMDLWKEEDENNAVNTIRINGRDNKTKRELKKKKQYKLRKLAEKAKIELSTKETTEIDLSEYYDDDFSLTVSREDFEECNQELFDRTIEITLNTLKKHKIAKNMIKEILLIGGSSQIPKVQEMLKNEFKTAKFNNSIDCNEVVARGAALFAHDKRLGLPSAVTAVSSHKISILGADKIEELIPEGTDIPHVHDFYVLVQGRDAFTELYEDREDVHTGKVQQVKLGRFYVNNLPANQEFCQFFASISDDGLLKVEGVFSNGQKMTCERQTENKKTQNREKVDEDAIVEQGKTNIKQFFEN